MGNILSYFGYKHIENNKKTDGVNPDYTDNNTNNIDENTNNVSANINTDDKIRIFNDFKNKYELFINSENPYELNLNDSLINNPGNSMSSDMRVMNNLQLGDIKNVSKYLTDMFEGLKNTKIELEQVKIEIEKIKNENTELKTQLTTLEDYIKL